MGEYKINEYTNVELRMTKEAILFTQTEDTLDGRDEGITVTRLVFPRRVAVLVAKAILRKYEPEALFGNGN